MTDDDRLRALCDEHRSRTNYAPIADSGLGRQRRVQIEYRAESVITRRTIDRDTGELVASEEAHRESWFGEHLGKPITAKSIAGWRCKHAVIESDDYEEARCGWCDSQGNDGEFTPCIAIKCPNCDQVCTDEPATETLSFIRHLTEECGV